MRWFEVDKDGLAKVLARKGKSFVLFELISNAWDEDVSRVDVRLDRIAGTRSVQLTVTDDSPGGFADLKHSFTLWSESKKREHQRGRFCMGEKLVLALCDSAEIASTTGTVVFDANGRHTRRQKLEQGTRFTATLKMTEAEREECASAVKTLLVPAAITTTFNGEALPARRPLASCEAVLPTEVADAEGHLRRSQRRTTVAVHEILDGEVGFVYELGVPVVESELPFHVDVGQRVPLSFDRDNLPPAFMSRLRALVLELMHERIEQEDANAAWVRDAIQHHGQSMTREAIDRVMTLKFGEKRLAADPSDPAATRLAVAAGYTIVHGGHLSAAEWEAVRRTGAILPAGKVTPSPKPYAEDGRELRLVPSSEWSPGMHYVSGLAHTLARRVLEREISVSIAMEPTWPFGATYGRGKLVLNAGRLGKKWFDGPLSAIVDLLVHEFGHEDELDHLSSRYHDALTRIAGGVVQVALDAPEIFARNGQHTFAGA
jgi:hypothetical protein